METDNHCNEEMTQLCTGFGTSQQNSLLRADYKETQHFHIWDKFQIFVNFTKCSTFSKISKMTKIEFLIFSKFLNFF
jgi:hypothetical protein